MSEAVLNELQLLVAMYDPAELNFHDQEVLHMVENCIPISDSVSITVRLNEFVELDIRMPMGYPESERLSAHCRVYKKNPASVTVDRNKVQQWESQFNTDLKQNYLLKSIDSTEENGDADVSSPDILGVIQWCNEYLEINPISTEGNSDSIPKDLGKSPSDESCRIWIFSHHIYNKNKRKFLINTAEELDLSGFSLPGKPGFVCIEGDPHSCDDYWSRVRQLCWQKISLIERQTFPSSDKIFQNKSFEELHCDKSAFIKFLEEKNCSGIIKDYLGI